MINQANCVITPRYFFAGLVLLSGCRGVPPDTYPLTVSDDFVEIAEFVADLIEAPESCRNWGEVGVHYSWDSQDFYETSGRCPPPGWEPGCPAPEVHQAYGVTYYWVINDEYDSIIYIAGEQNILVLGHEVLHHLLMCMLGYGPEQYQSGDNAHEHPYWALANSALTNKICNGVMPPFIVPIGVGPGPGYDTDVESSGWACE